MTSKTGKIYKLVCPNYYFYIGSTITTLNSRFSKHKCDSRTVNSKVYIYFNKIGWDNVKIQLIEELNINSREELLFKEAEYIKNNVNNEKCLNTTIPIIKRKDPNKINMFR